MGSTEECLLTLTLLLLCGNSWGDPDATRLYNDLLKKSGYNKLIRPVENDTDKLTVKLGMRLSQLIGVEWRDVNLQWSPLLYGGVSQLHVPADDIWKPDIVLYNNRSDANEVIGLTSGRSIFWTPPTKRYPPGVERAMEGVRFIADHMKEDHMIDQMKDDWKYVAMVIDRFFLWIFTTASLAGTIGIILQAPTLYDQRQPIVLQ